MSSRNDANHPELEALFMATREVEASFRQEHAQLERMRAELLLAQQRSAHEAAESRKLEQSRLAREEELRRQLTAAQARIQELSLHAKRLQDANARFAAQERDLARRENLELSAAKATCEHLQKKNVQLEDQLSHLKPQLERARQDLERMQSEVLERDHRQQAALLTFQGRERTQHDEIQMLRDQLRNARDELVQAKSRWLEAERLKQEADHAQRMRGPLEEKNRELEKRLHELKEKLILERRHRQESDVAAKAANQERERLQNALQAAEERVAFTEAELSRTSAEAAMLRSSRIKAAQEGRAAETAAARSSAAPDSSGSSDASGLTASELETLARLALPGYPVRD